MDRSGFDDKAGRVIEKTLRQDRRPSDQHQSRGRVLGGAARDLRGTGADIGVACNRNRRSALRKPVQCAPPLRPEKPAGKAESLTPGLFLLLVFLQCSVQQPAHHIPERIFRCLRRGRLIRCRLGRRLRLHRGRLDGNRLYRLQRRRRDRLRRGWFRLLRRHHHRRRFNHARAFRRDTHR